MLFDTHSRTRAIARVRVLAFVAVSLGFSANANAACFPPENRLPQNQIQSFLDNPTGILRSDSSSDALAEMVRNLVASDNETLPTVIKLLGSASPQQRGAIGRGLGFAAQACLGRDEIFAGQIQSAIAATGDLVAMTDFVSAGGQDTATAAITGAGAPSATAYVSGTFQVTGNSNITNNTPPVVQSRLNLSTTSLFTFSGTNAARSSRSSVSP